MGSTSAECGRERVVEADSEPEKPHVQDGRIYRKYMDFFPSYLKEENVDFIIASSVNDNHAAEQLKKDLERITFTICHQTARPRVTLLRKYPCQNNDPLWLNRVFNRSLVILMLITRNFTTEGKILFQGYSLLMEAVENKAIHVIPVYYGSGLANIELPLEMKHLQNKIQYTKRNKQAALEEFKCLLEANSAKYITREEKLHKTRSKYFTENEILIMEKYKYMNMIKKSVGEINRDLKNIKIASSATSEDVEVDGRTSSTVPTVSTLVHHAQINSGGNLSDPKPILKNPPCTKAFRQMIDTKTCTVTPFCDLLTATTRFSSDNHNIVQDDEATGLSEVADNENQACFEENPSITETSTVASVSMTYDTCFEFYRNRFLPPLEDVASKTLANGLSEPPQSVSTPTSRETKSNDTANHTTDIDCEIAWSDVRKASQTLAPGSKEGVIEENQSTDTDNDNKQEEVQQIMTPNNTTKCHGLNMLTHPKSDTCMSIAYVSGSKTEACAKSNTIHNNSCMRTDILAPHGKRMLYLNDPHHSTETYCSTSLVNHAATPCIFPLSSELNDHSDYLSESFCTAKISCFNQIHEDRDCSSKMQRNKADVTCISLSESPMHRTQDRTESTEAKSIAYSLANESLQSPDQRYERWPPSSECVVRRSKSTASDVQTKFLYNNSYSSISSFTHNFEDVCCENLSIPEYMPCEFTTPEITCLKEHKQMSSCDPPPAPVSKNKGLQATQPNCLILSTLLMDQTRPTDHPQQSWLGNSTKLQASLQLHQPENKQPRPFVFQHVENLVINGNMHCANKETSSPWKNRQRNENHLTKDNEYATSEDLVVSKHLNRISKHSQDQDKGNVYCNESDGHPQRSLKWQEIQNTPLPKPPLPKRRELALSSAATSVDIQKRPTFICEQSSIYSEIPAKLHHKAKNPALIEESISYSQIYLCHKAKKSKIKHFWSCIRSKK